MWRPTADPDTFQLVCENTLRAPGAYILAGVDCNCGARIDGGQYGTEAPIMRECAAKCDDDSACLSFGTWEDSERANG